MSKVSSGKTGFTFDTFIFYFLVRYFLLNPFSYRFVIQFKTSVSQQHIPCTYTHSYLPSFTQCEIFILDEPSIKQIHKRIMDDIKWERNITKELADTGGCFICSAARCSQPYQHRKNEDNAEHLEHTVHKYRLRNLLRKEYETKSATQSNISRKLL